MKKIVSLLALLAFAGSASAGITSWSETANASPTDPVGSLTNASLSVSVAYSDGSEFEKGGFVRNWYGDENQFIDELYLEKGKEVTINLTWSNSKNAEWLSVPYETDLLLWDGQGTGNASDAKINWASAGQNGDKDFSVSFTVSALTVDVPSYRPWLITFGGYETSFTTTNEYFDVFAQLNANSKLIDNSADNKKLGIGFRLNFDEDSKAPTPAVPAPGAVVLAGIGTSLAGRLRRRTL
ncbi:MAG: hypothetical protein GXY77_00965 [Fibrobacter sp.]|nr:hypothetical protein [Fibrobacter sp.]